MAATEALSDVTPAKAPDRRAFVALLAANAISGTGNWLTIVAIPWFVLQTTGSATQTGITGFFALMPVVLASVFGGAIVDRLGFKRTSVIADLASGITVALIPLLYGLGRLEFWVLLALTFLGALLDAPGATARDALLPDLAAFADVRIEQATSAAQVVERGSRLIGAPLAGVLIAVLGPTTVLWFDAATFAVSALLVAVAIPGHVSARPDLSSQSYLADLVSGFRFIRDDRVILSVLAILVITNFLDAIWTTVVAPVYAREVYGSVVALGLLFAASGGGAVVGALAYGVFAHRLPRRPVFIGSFVAAGSKLLFLATLPALPVAVAIQGLGGVAAGPLNPILGTMGFERIPAAMRGRVLGTISAAAFAAMPLGPLIAGPLLSAIGLQATLIAAGACYVATTLSMLANPALRDMGGR